MPALVVRDLVEWIVARGGQIVAGAGPPGLDRGVAGVARPRRLIGRELDALNAHDIVLMSLDAIAASSPDITLAGLIDTLAQTQAALIVAGLPPRASHETERAYVAADEAAFPLFAMPTSYDLLDLVRAIGELVQQREVAAARLVRDAVTAFNRGRRQEDSLRAQAQALADYMGLYFLLEDDRRVMLLTVAPRQPPCDEATVQAALASHAARQAVRPATPAALGDDIPIQRHLPGHLARAIVPLRSATSAIAYLSLLGPTEDVTPAHSDILWRIAPSFAFELGLQRKQQVDWHRTVADDLEAVLRRALPEAELARRAGAHGIDLGALNALIVAIPLSAGMDLGWMTAPLERLAALVPAPWAAPLDNMIAMVVSPAEQLPASLARLEQACNTEGIMALGLGRPGKGVAGLRQSLSEAEHAARVQRLAGPGLAAYDHLGVMRLLYPLHESGALEAFAQETLAPLLRADSFHGDSLIETLEAWFQANGNLTGAARRLKVHRNTFLYRLHRIEDVLHIDLEDGDQRLALHLAITIWRMLNK